MGPRAWLATLNVVGGLLVIGSYLHQLGVHENGGDVIWGGVPVGLKPLYQASMLGATFGYFPMTALVFFKLDPHTTRVGPFGYGAFVALYGLILLPSALWMPLTFQFAAAPSTALWWSVRGVLFIVGAGSVALLVALWAQDRRTLGAWHTWGLIGAALFTFQTAVLDALVWPAYW